MTVVTKQMHVCPTLTLTLTFPQHRNRMNWVTQGRSLGQEVLYLKWE